MSFLSVRVCNKYSSASATTLYLEVAFINEDGYISRATVSNIVSITKLFDEVGRLDLDHLLGHNVYDIAVN